MFTVTVRDRMMIAHSFTGEEFGPAQRLHGATFVVDASFRRHRLDDAGLVVDIAAAAGQLRAVLDEFDYRNLDELPQLAGRNTTTEALAQEIAERLVGRIEAGELGPGGRDLVGLQVTLHESDVAWASYETSW